MNLLPRNTQDFGKEKFWDDFFGKLRSKPFEWYGHYESLCEILDKYTRPREQLLVIGCGNSSLSADLYDVGYFNIMNIDISATVVQQMKQKYALKCPQMSFERMDMLQMTFENETYNVVLDKGTLDAIMVDSSELTLQKIDQMFSEISRVLKFGGRFICITLLQEHILKKLLDWYSTEGWFIRIVRCFRAEEAQSFPVFVVICTKMRNSSIKLLEVALDQENTVKRMNCEADIMDAIKSIQFFALVKNSLSKRKLFDDPIFLDLQCAKTGKTKYRLYVVDINENLPLKFAVFIVPQGRETDWLFSTVEGRKQCASSANAERLVLVHLLRGFEHCNLELVKKDLSENVMELAPAGVKDKVPFLSLGEDIGFREIKAEGESKISGSYVVEDVKQGDDIFRRRLIFLEKPYLVQSEARLKKVKVKRKNKKVFEWKVDLDSLACTHHAAMIYGLVFLDAKMLCPKILQIGLGGGGLAMYLHLHFPNALIEVVELDEAIVDLAIKWFDTVQDDRLSLHVADGLAYMQEMAQKDAFYDAIMIDVDSKDVTVGMSCPPSEFITDSMLSLYSKLIANSGVLLLNLVCRDSTLKAEVCLKISNAFVNVYYREIPQEINCVLYCTNRDAHNDGFQQIVDQRAKLLQEHSRCQNVLQMLGLDEKIKKLSVN